MVARFRWPILKLGLSSIVDAEAPNAAFEIAARPPNRILLAERDSPLPARSKPLAVAHSPPCDGMQTQHVGPFTFMTWAYSMPRRNPSATGTRKRIYRLERRNGIRCSGHFSCTRAKRGFSAALVLPAIAVGLAGRGQGRVPRPRQHRL